jgi:hypothetical protein
MKQGFLGTVFITLVSGIVLFSAHINIQRTNALESADHTRLVLSELNFQSIRIRQGFFRTISSAYSEGQKFSEAISTWYDSVLLDQGPVKLNSLRMGRVPSTHATLLCVQLEYLTNDPQGICGAFTKGEEIDDSECTRANETYPILDSLIHYSGDQITFSGVLPVDEREGCGVSRLSSDRYMIFGELHFLDEIASAVGILPGETIAVHPLSEELGEW